MRSVRTRVVGEATVSAIGLGDVSLATAASRNIGRSDVERALHEALSLDITFVDVADEDDSDLLVGNAIRALRLRDRVITAHRIAPALPRALQPRVDAKLRASRLEVLPLALLVVSPAARHAPQWPELVDGCARLVHAGKVLQWGALPTQLDGAIDLISEPWLTAIAAPYSLCDRAAEPLVAAASRPRVTPVRTGAAAPALAADPALTASLAADAARDPHLAAVLAGELERGFAAAPATADAPPPVPLPPLALLARHVLAGGALTGNLAPGSKLALRDDRRELDDATLDQIAIAMADLAPLVRHPPPAATSCEVARAALARGRRPDDVEAMDVAELALRFAIDRGALVLPRLHRREHVIGALAAAMARPLSAELHARLDARFPPPAQNSDS